MNVPTLQRILHVDDDPDIQEIARLALESVGGFTVQTCTSGSEALERAPGFKPDLVLLDVLMPDMDGIEILAKLRAIPPLREVPVIFMTAKAETLDLSVYLRLGALDVIMKPFDHRTLAETIREIWREHFASPAP